MKLTQSTKDAILTMKAQGYSSRSIGRVLNIGKSTVNDFLATQRTIGEEVLEGVKYVAEQRATKSAPPARILIIDIETAPFLAYTFRRWRANIGQANVEKEGYVLCYAAKWFGDDNIIFSRIQEPENDYEIVKEMKTLIDQADIVIAHNAVGFDLPTIATRMLFHGMTPFAPHKVVDTLKIAKQQFRFPSNSLESIAAYLGLAEQKMKHSGFGLWKRVMQMDEEAWNEMEEYNIQDILVLEKVYEKLRSWDKFAPNMALYTASSVPRCVVCASDKLEKLDKLSHTALSSFHTMRCKCCGKVMRTRQNVRSKEEMQATLTNVI